MENRFEQVIIVEDHLDAAQVLLRVCKKAFDDPQVDSAASVAGGLKLLQEKVYDVALLDLGLPDGSGIELAEFLSKNSPATMIIVTTIFDDENLLFNALRAGASGYLLKGHSEDQLEAYLKEAVQGQPPLSPSIAQSVLRVFRSGNQTTAVGNIASPVSKPNPLDTTILTEREIEILSLIAKGCQVKEVSKLLLISNNTVSVHIKNIYRKLNIHNRAEATAAAVGLKLYTPI